MKIMELISAKIGSECALEKFSLSTFWEQKRRQFRPLI